MSVETFLADNEAWLRVSTARVAQEIMDEALATKCSHIQLGDALLILTFERWERGIIGEAERDFLVKKIYS